jgi:hypothetical protein
LQLQTGARLTQNEAFRRLLEAGCEGLEHALAGHETPAQTPKPIAEISYIAEISNGVPAFLDDMPAFVDDEDEETPASPVSVPCATDTPVHHGRPGISRETLQAIADAYTRCQGLSTNAFAQHLFEHGIYRAKGKDGRAVPVDHTRLRRWLKQAREEAML